jgi:hypothetical protein
MKSIFTKIFAFSSIALLMLVSCKKDETKIVATTGKSGALQASATTLVLDKTKLTDTSKVMTFSFTQPDFGYSAAVTNTLQIDAMGDNWATPATAVIAAKKGKQGYSTADFNKLLLKLNLTGGVSAQVQVRIQHSLGAGVAPIYSNVLSLTVTPFNLTSYLYTVGAYQGWDIGHQDSLLSATSNGIYVGVLNFTAGNNQFLIVPGKNSYDNKYATNDPQNSTSSTVAIGGPNNLYAPASPGFYTVTLDVNAKTISFTPFTAYYSVIGDGAKGWNAGDDVDMKSANDGSGLWSVTLPLVSTGSIKVRKGHDWATSYGIPKTGADGATLSSSDDDNIPVPTSGTYKITFVPNADDTKAAYTLVKQ